MLLKVVTVAVWAAVGGLCAAHAQTIADIGGPRELPPSSYTSGQYVDSRGCVFLRAGYGGTTRWVPRVTNSRKVLCGYPPSLGAPRAPVAVAEAAPAPAPAPRATARTTRQPIETVATITAPPKIRATAPRSTVPATAYTAAPVVNAPAPRVVAPAAVAPAPRVVAQVAPRAAGCPAHAPYSEQVTLTDGSTTRLCTVRQGAVARVAAPQVVTSAPAYRSAAAATGVACPASAPVARQFGTTDGGVTVLCTTAGGGLAGAVAPLRGVRQGQAAAVEAQPQALASYRVSSNQVPKPPKGYKLAFKDDRLNPHRGEITRSGQAQQDKYWTRDFPARLIADVPHGKLKLVTLTDGSQYFISTGRAYKPKGAVVQRVVPADGLVVSSKSQVAKPQAGLVVSTKSEPAGKSYVQVGTFGQAGNAADAKARLAGLGLPVAGAKITKGGKALQIVYAGPFADAGQARAALTAARNAGFADAFIR